MKAVVDNRYVLSEDTRLYGNTASWPGTMIIKEPLHESEGKKSSYGIVRGI